MTPSEHIDKQVSSYPDWRGDILKELRKIINEVDPELEEGWKWGTAVWVKNGLVCAISGFKDHVKINFFKGAKLADPDKFFNSGLDSKSHRSRNFTEGEAVNASVIKKLVKEAISLNK